MRRFDIPPRPDWPAKVEKWGLTYHTPGGKPYWYESAYYTLDDTDVERIENATNELHRLCLETVDDLIRSRQIAEFGIPEAAATAMIEDYKGPKGHLYGRFDLAYDGESEPKLLEYNADTPTALLEAAVVQWQWSQDRFPGSDQFNSIWEALIARWQTLIADESLPGKIHFGHSDSDEDLLTVSLLRDTANAAGLRSEGLLMSEIGWNRDRKAFVDLTEAPIRKLFKLYPWEWMVREDFGEKAILPEIRSIWIEPMWKMLLSNKALLPILWQRYPGHPNLLPASFDEPRDLTDFVRKPLYSREGDGITVVVEGVTQEETPEAEMGPAGFEPRFVYQAVAPLYWTVAGAAVIGSWVVGNESCGVGIREADGWITTDTSRFVPHLIQP
jgi:glutathionylspermidine synthase